MDSVKLPPIRFRATYQGVVIGWYDTAIEAQRAVDKARRAEQREEVRRRSRG